MIITPTIEAKQTAAALTKGMKLIQTKGWCQHVGKNAKGQYCATGALYHATKNWSGSWTYALQDAITMCGFKQHDIVTFNDTRGRTKAQVLKVFRTAIQTAKKAAKGTSKV